MKPMITLLASLVLSLVVVAPAFAQETAAPVSDEEPTNDVNPAEPMAQPTVAPAADVAPAQPSQPVAPSQPEAAAKQGELRLEASLGESEPPAEAATSLEEPKEGTLQASLEFHAKLQTIMVLKNDNDFDSTRPYYNKNGQTVGNLGTFFQPRLVLSPMKNLRLVWEMELGLNLWSRNNPDRYETGNFDSFLLAQRELYTEGSFVDGLVGFKVGYQEFRDPTGLFLGHWIGAASFISDATWAKFTLSGGQLPDQTAEGVGLEANNFRRDTFFYGFRVDVPMAEWMLSVGLYGLHDTQIVDQTLQLYTPSLRVSGDYQWIKFGLDLAFQGGTADDSANEDDESITAWASQAFVEFDEYDFAGGFNLLMLSADDATDRNPSNHGFFYSGKSRSRTIMLTEDEIRDRGANLDEAIGEERGAFKVIRPGLVVVDGWMSYDVADVFRPALIVGAGMVLEPENALDGTMIGIEADLDLELYYKEMLSFHLIGGLLIPGSAGAAFVNLSDREATNTQYMLETSLSVMF